MNENRLKEIEANVHSGAYRSEDLSCDKAILELLAEIRRLQNEHNAAPELLAACHAVLASISPTSLPFALESVLRGAIAKAEG